MGGMGGCQNQMRGRVRLVELRHESAGRGSHKSYLTYRSYGSCRTVQEARAIPPQTRVFPVFLKKNKKKSIFFGLGYWHFEKNGYNIG